MPAAGGSSRGGAPTNDRLLSLSPAALSSLLSTPDVSAAASPLQRRIRHTRLFPPPPLMSSSSAVQGSATSATSPRIETSVEAMTPRTVLKPNPRQLTTLWQPTRLTSSYCVLSAAGVQEDFYTSALSWGTHQMALALEQSLVLFHPSHPRQSSSSVQISQEPAGMNLYEAPQAFHHPRRATAVAMSRCSEISCFLGLSNGAVELYEGRGDGRLHCTVAFAMPEPPTDYLSGLLGVYDGLGSCSSSAATSRAARALSLLGSSVSSVSCIGTSDRYPWLGAAATAARGLVALDARRAQPVLRFGGEAERGAEVPPAGSSMQGPGADASNLYSFSTSSTNSAGDGGGLSRLQRTAAYLRQHDRLCSVSWNSTGSLVATGSSGGVVKVWSLSAPQRPLHSFLIDQECTVKALSFHPERPYELLVGGSAGPAGLRTYDLSRAAPVLVCRGATAAPVTQALFDPAGSYAVTCAGTPIDIATAMGAGAAAAATVAPAASRASPTSPLTTSPLQRASPSGAASRAEASMSSVLDGSPRWGHSSPARSGTGASFGATPAVPLLHDSWDDMDTAAVDDDDDDAAALSAEPEGWLGESAGRGLAAVTAHRAPANAVVLWRCASRCRDAYLRDALLRDTVAGCGSGAEDGDGDDATNGDDNDTAVSVVVERRTSRFSAGVEDDAVARGEDGWPRSEWLPLTSLPGHRARPLLLCAPFPQSPFAGCYASLAAGEDCTIRFWRLFETASNATHWQQRRQAQQRSATTQEDMDLFATPVLR